jgi:CRISPR-associated protein Csx17
MYEFATRAQTDQTGERRALLNVLRAVGRAERTLANGIPFCEDNYIHPLQGLNRQWLDQANDDSPEFSLAAAVAGVCGDSESYVVPFRVHLEPVTTNRRGQFEWEDASTSAVWSNRPLDANLAAVFRRRQMEAFRAGRAGVPLASARPVRLLDVLAFLNADINDEKLHDLIWALSAMDWPPGRIDPEPAEEPAVPFEFGVLRLLVEPLPLAPHCGRWRFGDAEATAPNAEVFQPLMSGREDAVREGVDRAARRLKSGGLLVVGYRNRRQAGKSLAVISRLLPARLLAACLFPLSTTDLEGIANAVLYPPEPQE